jgi:hypothetical protein
MIRPRPEAPFKRRTVHSAPGERSHSGMSGYTSVVRFKL